MSGARVPPEAPETRTTPEAEEGALLERCLVRALARLFAAQEAERARAERMRRLGR